MNTYYDPEFKKNAVELLLSSGKSIKQIARELGCSASSLGEWRKELTRVTQEREILKKAAAILGR